MTDEERSSTLQEKEEKGQAGASRDMPRESRQFEVRIINAGCGRVRWGVVLAELCVQSARNLGFRTLSVRVSKPRF